jgi:hypothetical protein
VKLIAADAIPVREHAMAYAAKVRSHQVLAVKILISAAMNIPAIISEKGRKLQK